MNGSRNLLLADRGMDWETGGEYAPSGNMTQTRRPRKGLRARQMLLRPELGEGRGLREHRPAKDPPPDLAIEIEVSRTVLGRCRSTAAFKIPEVWRYDGTTTDRALAPAGRVVP